MIKILFIGDSRMIHFRRIINYFYDNFDLHVSVLVSNKDKRIRAHNIFVNDYLSKSKKKWIINSIRLRSLIKKYKIDIINIHYLPSGFTSIFISSPLISTGYGGDINELPRKWFSWNKILTKILILKSKAVYVDSFDLKNNLVKNLNANDNKIKYFQWGVNLDNIKNNNQIADSRKGFNIPLNKKVIVSYRGWGDRYNILTLLDAYAALIKTRDDVILVIKNTAIVYDHDYKVRVEKRLNKDDLKDRLIILPNRLSYKKLIDLLHISDIYVSIPDYDGTAMSLLESMACGAIPLLSNISSSKEWIEHLKNGFLCDINKENIIQNLNAILNHSKNELDEMKKYNLILMKEKADEKRWMNILKDQYLKIYDNSK